MHTGDHQKDLMIFALFFNFESASLRDKLRSDIVNEIIRIAWAECTGNGKNK